MKKIVLIQTSSENYSHVIEVLQMLIGNHMKYHMEKQYLLVECSKEIEGILETIRSLESDLDALIHFYQTSTNQPEKEISLVLPCFLKAGYGHYDFKSLLYQVKTKSEAAELFNFIVEGSGVTEEIILAMAECNLNVSQASSMLYMHRNTLLYKMDRLIALKNFDLKKFNDLYILIQLIRA